MGEETSNAKGWEQAMPKLRGELGPLERTVMDHIWEQGADVTVRDVLESAAGGRLAYTTVMTILDRLWRKGFLRRSRVGRAYVYRVKRTEQEYLAGLLDGVLAGAADRQSVLLGFMRGIGQEDLVELRGMIREVERERKNAP